MSGAGHAKLTLSQFEHQLRQLVKVYDIFLSHAGEQKEFVWRLRAILEQRWPGLQVFLDEASIRTAESNMEQMFDSLQSATVVVLVLSKEFLEKPYPMEELHLAMKRCRLGFSSIPSQPVLPVQLVPVLKGITFADVKAKANWYRETATELQQQAANSSGGQLDDEGYQGKFRCLAGTKAELGKWFQGFAQDLAALMGIAAIAHQADSEHHCELVLQTIWRCLARPGTGLLKLKPCDSTVVVDDAVADKLLEDLTCSEPAGASAAGHEPAPAEGQQAAKQQAVLLTGMAGMGKSVLARRAVEVLANELPHMFTCVVDLQNAGRLDDASITRLQQSILDQLGVGVPVGKVADVKQYLKGKSIIMLLDNVVLDNGVPCTLDRVLPGLTDIPKGLLGLLGSGSMVIITSCGSRLGSGFGEYVTHHMQHMQGDLPLRLLLKLLWFDQPTHTAEQAYERLSSEVRQAIKDILQKCAGCPLAVRRVGRYLAANRGDWLSIARDGVKKFTAAMQVAIHSGEHGSRFDQLLQAGGHPDGAALHDHEGLQVAILKDIAFFFAEHNEPLHLLQWCFTDEAAKALQQLGMFDLSGPSGSLHTALVEMFKVGLGRSLRIKQAATQLQEFVQQKEECRKLKALWLNGETVCGEDLLGRTQRHGKELRLLQLACGLQGTLLLKPQSESLYLLGVGTDASVEQHPATVTVNSTRRQSEIGDLMVMLDKRPELETLNLIQCKHAHALWVSNCLHLKTIQLAGLQHLQRLCLVGCPELTDIDELADLQLAELSLCGCSMAAVSTQLAGCSYLACLVLQSCKFCTVGACLRSMEMFSSTHAATCSISLQPLHRLTRLELQLPPPPSQQQQQQQQMSHQRSAAWHVSGSEGATCLNGTPTSGMRLSVQAVSGSPASPLEARQTSSTLGLQRLSMLATVQCLEAVGAPNLQDCSGDHCLGHVLVKMDDSPASWCVDESQRSSILQLRNSCALQRLHIHGTLKEACMTSCARLEEVVPLLGIEEFQLVKLVLQDCPRLNVLPDVATFRALTHLELERCPAICTIMLGGSVRELRLQLCARLEDIAWSGEACATSARLWKLRVVDCPQLATLPDMQLHLLPSLSLLDLRGCGLLRQLRLGPSLVRAYVHSCGALTCLQAAAGAGEQATAEARLSQQLADISLLQHAAASSQPRGSPGDLPAWRLQVLRVHDCSSLKSIEGVPLLGHLGELTIGGCGALQRLELSSSLRRLSVDSCAALTRIQCLARAEMMEAADSRWDHPAASRAGQLSAAQFPFLAAVVVSACPQLQWRPCRQHPPHPRLCKCSFGGEEVPLGEWRWCPSPPAAQQGLAATTAADSHAGGSGRSDTNSSGLAHNGAGSTAASLAAPVQRLSSWFWHHQTWWPARRS